MTQTLDLNGQWHFLCCDEGEARVADVLHREEAMPATVPGDVHNDLFNAGAIPHPYLDRNVDDLQWTRYKEWWYFRRFTAPAAMKGDRVELLFEGLDTHATVYLNGEELGSHANMFVPVAFDVTHKVLWDRENSVAVRFASTTRICEEKDRSGEGYRENFFVPRIHARKAGYSWGWDWAPRLPGIGIWQPVRLLSYRTARLRDVFVRTESVEEGRARVCVSGLVEGFDPTPGEGEVRAELERGGRRVEAVGPVALGQEGAGFTLTLDIDQPALWWPNGYGDQPLYGVSVQLECGDAVLDEHRQRLGIRTVGLYQEEHPEKGRYFAVTVNGQCIFCKGGNWVPCDSMLSGATTERYRESIRLARDAHCTMLRVWGGGIYETPEFYDACDEMGILVWQDFPYACAVYPQDAEFCAEARREAVLAVKRLRNYASLAVWCGNNENRPGHPIYDKMLPRVVAELDPSRPYRKASPCSDGPGEEDPMGHGDVIQTSTFGVEHQGDVHGPLTFFGLENGRWAATRENYDRLNLLKHCARMTTEAYSGMCPPEMESLQRFMPADKLWPLNDHWRYRNPENPWILDQIGLDYTQAMLRRVELFYGGPESAGDFVKWAALFNAEFIRLGVEHWRSRKWDNAGVLWWMYNECWPGVDFGFIDYYLVPKVNYYFLKRAQAPLAVCCLPDGNRPRVHILNDTRSPETGRVTVTRLSLDSGVVASSTTEVDVRANESLPVEMEDPDRFAVDDPARQIVVARLECDGAFVSQSPCFFSDPGGITFPRAEVVVRVDPTDTTGHYAVTVSAGEYARCVRLAMPGAYMREVPVWFEDNYFDLLPGQSRTLTVIAPESEINALTALSWHEW